MDLSEYVGSSLGTCMYHKECEHCTCSRVGVDSVCGTSPAMSILETESKGDRGHLTFGRIFKLFIFKYL